MKSQQTQSGDNECPSCGFKYDGVLRWHNMNGECELMNNTKVQPLIGKIKPQQEDWDNTLYQELRELADKEWEELPQERKDELRGACVIQTITSTPEWWFNFIDKKLSTERQRVFMEVSEMIEHSGLNNEQMNRLQEMLTKLKGNE